MRSVLLPSDLRSPSTDVHMAMLAALPSGRLLAAYQGSAYGEGCNEQKIFMHSSDDGGLTWSNRSVLQQGPYAVWG